MEKELEKLYKLIFEDKKIRNELLSYLKITIRKLSMAKKDELHKLLKSKSSNNEDLIKGLIKFLKDYANFAFKSHFDGLKNKQGTEKNASKASKASKAIKASKASNASKVSKASNASKVSKVSKVSKASKASNAKGIIKQIKSKVIKSKTKSPVKLNELTGLVAMLAMKPESPKKPSLVGHYLQIVLKGIIKILSNLLSVGAVLVGKLGRLAKETFESCTGNAIRSAACYTMIWGLCSYVSLQNLQQIDNSVSHAMYWSLQTLCQLLPVKPLNNFKQTKDRNEFVSQIDKDLKEKYGEDLHEEELDTIKTFQNDYKATTNRKLRGRSEIDKSVLKSNIDDYLEKNRVGPQRPKNLKKSPKKKDEISKGFMDFLFLN